MSPKIHRYRHLFAPFLAAALVCLTPSAVTASDSPYAYTAERVVAVGDIHGAYDSFVQLLIANQVIDTQLQWTASTTHLVSLGDLLDRGPDSRKVMDLLMRLQNDALAVGGKVHVLLGNHEAMNLVGDLRNVSEAEYAAFSMDESKAPAGEVDPLVTKPEGYYQHRAAFGKDGHYGAWLLSLPSLIRINDTVFVHGGLSPLVNRLGLAGTNEQLKRALEAHVAVEARVDSLPPILDDPGPLWYRGTAACHELIEDSILSAALKALHAQRVVIGHTPTPTRKVMQRLDGRVLAIDTGMLTSVYKGQAFALELSGNEISVLDAQGTRSKRIVESHAVGKGWGDFSEMELAQQLMVSRAAEDNVSSRDFLFKDIEGRTHKANFVPVGKKRAKAAEALWRLDRMLGLNMVPLTLARKIDKRWGYLDFSRGRWMTEAQRQADRRARPNFCLENNDYQLQAAFDLLTQGKLRRPEALSYQVGTWAMKLTDQHLSFPRTTKLLSYGQNPNVPAQLAAQLRALTAAGLEESIGSLVDGRQISSMLKRRDKLLALSSTENP